MTVLRISASSDFEYVIMTSDMEIIYALLVSCEATTGRFSSLWAGNVETVMFSLL